MDTKKLLPEYYFLQAREKLNFFPIAFNKLKKMQAEINLTDSTSNLWSIYITDLTTGKHYQASFMYASSRLSSEWIVERPAVNNGTLSTLANFGNVTFSNCHTTLGDNSAAISDFPYRESQMFNNVTSGTPTKQLVAVTDLTNKGTQFAVTYLNG